MTANNYHPPLHNVQGTSAVDAETRAGREVMVQQDEVAVADQTGRAGGGATGFDEDV